MRQLLNLKKLMLEKMFFKILNNSKKSNQNYVASLELIKMPNYAFWLDSYKMETQLDFMVLQLMIVMINN